MKSASSNALVNVAGNGIANVIRPDHIHGQADELHERTGSI
ncbi:hypothetical protein [Natronoglycomyces albus]|nr:hypothetical protein [Natronoglycomyces albus]